MGISWGSPTSQSNNNLSQTLTNSINFNPNVIVGSGNSTDQSGATQTQSPKAELGMTSTDTAAMPIQLRAAQYDNGSGTSSLGYDSGGSGLLGTTAAVDDIASTVTDSATASGNPMFLLLIIGAVLLFMGDKK